MPAKGEQLEQVHRLVAQGEYRVNSERVAAAILDRIGVARIDRKVVMEREREGDRALLRALTGPRVI